MRPKAIQPIPTQRAVVWKASTLRKARPLTSAAIIAGIGSSAVPQAIPQGMRNGRRLSGIVTRRRMIERWAIVIASVAPKA